MDVNDAISSIDLTPGATNGVLYDGMSADGSKVFFTTTDTLQRRRHRHKRRHLSRPKSRRHRRHPDPDLHRHGRHGRHQLLRSGSELQRRTLEHGRLGQKLRRARDRRRRRNRSERRFGLLPLPREARRRRQRRPGPTQPLPRRPRLGPHFIATLDPEDPVVVDSLKAVEQRQHRGLPGHAKPASSQPSRPTPTAERKRKRRLHRRSTATTRQAARSTASPATRPTRKRQVTPSLAGAGLSLTADGRVFFNSDDALVLRGRRQPQGCL